MASSYMNTMNVSMTPGGDTFYVAEAWFSAKILENAMPYLVTDMFGQGYPLPTKSTRAIKFRRYDVLDNAPLELIEGVTPIARKITFNNIEAFLRQYGATYILTDVLVDTADTNIMQDAAALIGRMAAEMVERIRLDVLLGGSNVVYANGTARSDVNTPMTLDVQNRITRQFRRSLAPYITQVIASTPSFYTESVRAAYVALCHPDCDTDIRNMPGFKDAVDYGTRSTYTNEIGAVGDVRYLWTTMMPVYPDAGGARVNTAGDTMISTSGTNADVYPILFLAQDAYGIVPLRGMDSLTPIIVKAASTDSDPLAQRNHIGFKTMQTAVILNQAWIARAEVAVTDIAA